MELGLLLVLVVVVVVVVLLQQGGNAPWQQGHATVTPTPAGSLDSLGRQIQSLVSSRPGTVVRTYQGKQQRDATIAFQREAPIFAQFGYQPSSQSWAQGQWGCGAFLLALLLCIVLIGILIFIYLLVVKPEGTLTVTYALRESPPPPPAPVAVPSAPTESLQGRLSQLQSLRDAGHITDAEYDERRKKLLDEI